VTFDAETNWDKGAFLRRTPISDQDKQEMADYLRASTKMGKHRDEILEELGEKYHRSTRQIERYIEKCSPSEQQQEAPTEVVTEQEPYEETPHKQKMRKLSRELAKIRLPSIRDSFLILDAAPEAYDFLCNDCFLEVVQRKGREIAAFADMKYLQNPNSDFDEADFAWVALFSHLKTGGLAEVIEKIEYFDSKSGLYSEQCRTLYTMVSKKIQDDTHLAIRGKDEGKPCFTPLFPVLICEDAVNTCNGSSNITDYSYETEPLGSRWVLRCNRLDIYVDDSEEKLNEYKELHKSLRLQWVDYDKNQSIKNIAELHNKLGAVTRKIKKDLLIFAGKEQLPGHCELC